MKLPKGYKRRLLLKYLYNYVVDISHKLYVRPHLDSDDKMYHNQRADLTKLVEQVQVRLLSGYLSSEII